MAIDSANKRRAFLGLPPIPDGSLDSSSDRFQMIEIYGFNVVSGAVSFQPPNFILKLATLDHTLILSSDEYDLIMEDRSHDLKIN